MKNRLVVIGGDAAGMSAASKVRRLQPDREIIVFEKSSYTSYSACGIPYYISEMITDYNDLIIRTPEEFRNEYNIDVRIKSEVIDIDTNTKKVHVKNLEDDSTFWQEYDQLLIATGAHAFCPDIKGNDAEGVFGVSTIRNGIEIEQYIEDKKPETAVIIGGGYIGLEMAEALTLRDIKVTIINRSEQVMNTLDPDMGKLISEKIEELGITLHCNESLTGFETKEGSVTAVISDKRTLSTNLVILGMGSSPNTSFIKGSGIKTGVKNAIKVNARMQTNIEDVWAAGDCAETLHLTSKRHVYIALGTIANKTGLVAGSNIAGEALVFPGVVGTAVSKICEYEIARTGLLEEELNDLEIEYVSGNYRK